MSPHPLASVDGVVAGFVPVELPSGLAQLQLVRVGFPVWDGTPPTGWSGSYRTKRLVDVGGGGEFAELAVARVLRNEGWEAVWLDNYRRRIVFRVDVTEADERRAFILVELPERVEALLEAISHRAHGKSTGSGRARSGGRFDVLAWRDDEWAFLECKQAGTSDRFRPNQQRWLAAALSAGLPESSFWLVEWTQETRI